MSIEYSILIDNDYVTPNGILTKEQYVEFVMNFAAESYKNQYNTADKDSGIQAACDAYNANLNIVEEVVEEVVDET
jgi:hypothetical protein